MSTSNVTICNAALGMLGAQSISSLDDSTERARLCKDVYPQARAQLLRSHPWNCATKRALLAPLTTAPAFGYSYQYQLPDDYVRVQSVDAQEYELEGRKLLADQSSIALVYTYDAPEGVWDSLLIEAMSLLLASKLSKAITGSSTDAAERMYQFKELVKQARSVDGQEQPVGMIDPYESSLLSVRY
jgi:hypothetical protein